MRALALSALLVGCNGKPLPDGIPAEVGTGDTSTETTTTPTDPTDPTDTTTTTFPYGYDAREPNVSCHVRERPPTGGDAIWEPAFPGVALSSAIALARPDHTDDYWYVATQPGEVYRFDAANPVPTLVLDHRANVDDSAGELGLLSVAFHPNFQANGFVFLYYTANGRISTLSRFTTLDGGLTLDPGSESKLLEVPQPYNNHNGGTVAFGPDGYLYLSLGDGGSAGDPANRAQDNYDLLGKILRLDVDSGTPYAIPGTNPFVLGGGLPEIYAKGFRNPFRFSIDAVTGELWTGDVGQDEFEEVNKVILGRNYGWRLMEGFECYDPATGCEFLPLEDPVAVYQHTLPSHSVVGGVVYRGSALPGLVGSFLYTDFYEGGNVTALVPDAITLEPVPTTIVIGTGQVISQFAADLDGEVYGLDYYAGISKLVPAGPAVVSDFPERLSDLGCFENLIGMEPSSGVVPYELNHPFWSDAADKTRWMAIPDGTELSVVGDDIEFPVGAVLVKHFERAGQRIETRVMMRHDDGNWGAYSYLWNELQTDADLLPGRVSVDVGGPWDVPSRAECMQCHTAESGRTLGPELSQLGGSVAYPTGRVSEQRGTLEHIGWLTAVPLAAEFPTYDDPSNSAEVAARAWLHTNCSWCHRPGVGIEGDMDLRFETPLNLTNLCVAPSHGDLGIPGAQLVAPGDSSSSILVQRATRRDGFAMPPLGSYLIDPVGEQALSEWVDGLASCP